MGKGERKSSTAYESGADGMVALTERATHAQSSKEKEEARRRMAGTAQYSFDSQLLQSIPDPGKLLTIDLRQDGRSFPANSGIRIDGTGSQDDFSRIIDSARVAAQQSPQW